MYLAILFSLTSADGAIHTNVRAKWQAIYTTAANGFWSNKRMEELKPQSPMGCLQLKESWLQWTTQSSSGFLCGRTIKQRDPKHFPVSQSWHIIQLTTSQLGNCTHSLMIFWQQSGEREVQSSFCEAVTHKQLAVRCFGTASHVHRNRTTGEMHGVNSYGNTGIKNGPEDIILIQSTTCKVLALTDVARLWDDLFIFITKGN